MGTLEKFIAGAFALIAIALFLSPKANTVQVFKAASGGFSDIFRTLQAYSAK